MQLRLHVHHKKWALDSPPTAGIGEGGINDGRDAASARTQPALHDKPKSFSGGAIRVPVRYKLPLPVLSGTARATAAAPSLLWRGFCSQVGKPDEAGSGFWNKKRQGL
jgi:hypothetical protein